MQKRRRWVFVGNSARAFIYEPGEGTRKWRLIKALDNPEARLRNLELSGDKSGRNRPNGARGPGSHKEPPTPPKESRKQAFARKTADLLATMASRQAYDELVLVASPYLLGLLRQSLSGAVKRRLVKSVGKDYTLLKPHELPRKLEPFIPRTSRADISARRIP